MIIDTFFMTIFCIMAVYTTAAGGDHDVVKLANRFECVFIVNFFLNLAVYIAYVCQIKLRRFKPLYLAINALVIFVIFLSPVTLEITDDLSYLVSRGLAIDITMAVSVVLLSLSFIISMANSNKLKEKLVPVGFLLMFIVLIAIIRAYKPEIIVLEFLASFATLIMFVTIENPDRKALELQTKLLRMTKRAENMAVKADAVKDDFIAMASHQLRTPLTSMKGYISMLLDGDFGHLTAEQKRVLGEAYSSSERMTFLIGDFLDVSRLQTGKFELQKTPTKLDEILASEVQQMRIPAEMRQVKLECESPIELPEINCDRDKIRQVMINMIDNAIFYSHADSKVNISLYQQRGQIVFKVQDQGIGVPRPEQHKLFTEFYRASNARQARPDGTGVGLYVARKVITAHGGSLIFESRENVGSTFGFRLPIKSGGGS
jgi:signal transduction histidine kinase